MSKRSRKPSAYLTQYYDGYFMLERTRIWIAEDTFGNRVATGRTRKECEDECRRKGYRPEK